MKLELETYVVDSSKETKALLAKLQAAKDQLTVIRAHRIQMDAHFNRKQVLKFDDLKAKLIEIGVGEASADAITVEVNADASAEVSAEASAEASATATAE